MCKYLNFFPEKIPSQLCQSEKKDECLPDVVAIELQRASSVLNRDVKKTPPPTSWNVIMTSKTQYADELQSKLKSV